MAGRALRGMLSTADYKGGKALKSCHTEFVHIYGAAFIIQKGIFLIEFPLLLLYYHGFVYNIHISQNTSRPISEWGRIYLDLGSTLRSFSSVNIFIFFKSFKSYIRTFFVFLLCLSTTINPPQKLPMFLTKAAYVFPET